MSVSSITQAYSQYAQQAATTGSPGGTQASVAAAVQEANESKATTVREAKNGDRVAIRKLQRQGQQPAPTPDASVAHRHTGAIRSRQGPSRG